MGQYYYPIILAENKKTVKAWMYSHKYENGLKLMEHSWLGNKFVNAFESLIKDNPKRVVWAGDYADECKGLKTNLYQRCSESSEVFPRTTDEHARFVINHTKNEFVDTKKCPISNFWIDPETGVKDPFIVHPLPLLTCEGNGRGGGDFRPENKYVGTWARDLVSVSDKQPEGFDEIKPDFKE
jgi:hypothetical protein